MWFIFLKVSPVDWNQLNVSSGTNKVIDSLLNNMIKHMITANGGTIKTYIISLDETCLLNESITTIENKLSENHKKFAE